MMPGLAAVEVVGEGGGPLVGVCAGEVDGADGGVLVDATVVVGKGVDVVVAEGTEVVGPLVVGGGVVGPVVGVVVEGGVEVVGVVVELPVDVGGVVVGADVVDEGAGCDDDVVEVVVEVVEDVAVVDVGTSVVVGAVVVVAGRVVVVPESLHEYGPYGPSMAAGRWPNPKLTAVCPSDQTASNCIGTTCCDPGATPAKTNGCESGCIGRPLTDQSSPRAGLAKIV